MEISFTLVSTVFNENLRLEQSINDIRIQTLQPAEIIITDAGSTDGTFEALKEWAKTSYIPIKILLKHRCNVAEGRNMAIRASSHQLIVSTDFGCRFDKDWLKNLTAPFSRADVQVVGGAFGIIETDQQSLAAKAAYILAGGYKIDVHADWFLPSSRSIAYYKNVFEAVGGYCESLTLAGDDTLFAKEIRAKGFQIFKSEYVGVFWGRHPNDKGYIKEAYRYGLGDGEAGINKRSFISNSIELAIRYLLVVTFPVVLLLVLFGKVSIEWLLVCLPLMVGLRSYKNYLWNWLQLRSNKYNMKVFVYGFFLMERIKLDYIKGYLQGRSNAKKGNRRTIAYN